MDGTKARARGMASEELHAFFHPKGAVIVGRPDTTPKGMKRIGRLGCPVCFVNPKGGESGGIPVYKSIAEVPDGFDLAIVKVSAERCLEIIQACADRGIPRALLWSSGFAEVGPEGADVERRLAELVRRTGVRVVGPNTNENAYEPMEKSPSQLGGCIGLVTRSGGAGRPIVQGTQRRAAFSRWIATGNEVDLDVADCIEYFVADETTQVVAAYVEGFKSADKLRSALEKAHAADKPFVVLKIGSTEKGASAAASHTGHLSGSDAVVNGMFAQYGVTRVRDFDELLETANLFAKMPKTSGVRCVAYTGSGGAAALMSEVAETFGVPLPSLHPDTRAGLSQVIPGYLNMANPVDYGGHVLTGPKDKRIAVLDCLAGDPNVDVIVVGIPGSLGLGTDNMGADLIKWLPTSPKPVVAVWSSIRTDDKGYQALVQSGAAVFHSFQGCFKALRAFGDYQERRSAFRRRPANAGRLDAAQTKALSSPGILSAANAQALLRAARIPLAKEKLVRSADEARRFAAEIAAPVALKLMSEAFPHKSDVGLVRLNVSPDEAAAVHAELVERAARLDAKAVIEGVLVQEQVPPGVEMIVGLSNDAQFGPALTLGTGGIYAEILRDVQVRPLPLDRRDIEDMIDSLRLAPRLLAGARGAAPANRAALVDVALAVANLAAAANGRIAELDLNPVIVLPDRAVAVDALVVAAPAKE